jgi:hypothetical protein
MIDPIMIDTFINEIDINDNILKGEDKTNYEELIRMENNKNLYNFRIKLASSNKLFKLIEHINKHKYNNNKEIYHYIINKYDTIISNNDKLIFPNIEYPCILNLIQKNSKYSRFTNYISIIDKKKKFYEFKKQINREFEKNLFDIIPSTIDNSKNSNMILIYMLLFPEFKFILLLNNQDNNIELIDLIQEKNNNLNLIDKKNIKYFLQLNYNNKLDGKNNNSKVKTNKISIIKKMYKYYNFADLLYIFRRLNIISDKYLKKITKLLLQVFNKKIKKENIFTNIFSKKEYIKKLKQSLIKIDNIL